MRVVLHAVAIAAALTSLSSNAQQAAELRVLSSNGVRAVLEELKPRLESAAGARIALELSTARTLKQRIDDGEAFDVAILTPELIGELVDTRKIDEGSTATFARVGVGVGVAPDFVASTVASIDDLRRVLLAAGSVAYGANGQSRETNEAALDALGIMEAVRPKVRLTGPGEAPRLVASGDVDVVLTLVSELVGEPGLRYVGPLPAELQAYIYFTAGVAAQTRDRAAADALIDFLGSAEVMRALGSHGLEPAGP